MCTESLRGNLGLSSRVALARLHEDVQRVLITFEEKFRAESLLLKIQSAFVERYDSPLGWFSILTTITIVAALAASKHYFSALTILIILSINLFFVIRENNLRRTEIFRKVRVTLGEIKLAEELCGEWEDHNYAHLCCPLSPCVSLQWTYRDGIIVNLPWALLVRGDSIVIRPGQTAPGACTEVDGKRKFKANEIYSIMQPVEPPAKPIARSPLPDLICVLENTPYLENLKIVLGGFLNRPPTIYNQQRYLLVTKYIQQWGTISGVVIALLAGTLRSCGAGFPELTENAWKEIFLESFTSSIIPILPLIFPLMWISLNLWGIARLDTFLGMPQPQITADEEKSFREDLDTPTYECDDISLPRAAVLRNWIELWNGKSDLLGRSANVVQVLGSITALCCVDKKGILSWPNPTAEKIFFLHDSSDLSSSESQTSLEPGTPKNNTTKSGVVAEVLDLTHDQHCPFKLEFDDHEWKNHISSLKPLGLAILLNTCSPQTHAHYAQFCGHVTAVAMLDKDLVPVTNRRCLCELAKQIGFTSHATDRFSLEGQLATYRHLQPEVVQRDIRFARQLHFASKVKVPFPHSLSVVLREVPGGYLSLFTQGTADIVLDCCDDFWDGKDLKPLGPQERKRAQDFYQRSALTAYCTAFAYRPLRHGICGALSGSQNGNFAYLELPPETKCKMQHVDKSQCDFEGHTKLSHSISTDSLLFSETKDESITDVDGCFEMQCHQVFIGMITMQYQAQTDIVQLVERLERACIRFVHFSKENELRSRVFSEKMGLESGWNCHISLLSEESPSNLHSPKNSGHFDIPNTITSMKEDEQVGQSETNCLIPPAGLECSKTLSSSAPGAISNQEYNMLSSNSMHCSKETITEEIIPRRLDGSIVEEHCRSLSVLTTSTEQSAPVHFDMSNRAKLPRGIENIRPHLEKVDNVPLQVSLFTDCSAEATREMLSIMQSYGEIVVCIGSSASNSNAEIFLQADCSIAVEPLYPQVCQDIPAYTESNILNNKIRVTKPKDCKTTDLHFENGSMNFREKKSNTLSPIYLSRLLNSLPCSISVQRDDPMSILSIVELSRRFSIGLWNCIQFWACCACSLAFINVISACLSLPPAFTPITLIYLMCCAVPLIALSLIHIESDSKVMNRATGKKQTKFDSRVFGFVLWCYGCKFLPTIFTMVLSYCVIMSHPIKFFDIDEDDRKININIARIFLVLGVVLHFVIISTTFVHRDYLIRRKNPFSNYVWAYSCLFLIVFHFLLCTLQIFLDDEVYDQLPNVWPIFAFIISTVIFTLAVTEFCKWEEIKVNLRYQRRARLDFGTKLGMNSPF